MNWSRFARHKIRSSKPIASMVICLLAMACNSQFEVSLMRRASGSCNETGSNLNEDCQTPPVNQGANNKDPVKSKIVLEKSIFFTQPDGSIPNVGGDCQGYDGYFIFLTTSEKGEVGGGICTKGWFSIPDIALQDVPDGELTVSVNVRSPDGKETLISVTKLKKYRHIEISPTGATLSTNEVFPFSASFGTPNSDYVFSLKASPSLGLTLDSSSGLLTAANSAGSFSVEARDDGGNIASLSAQIKSFQTSDSSNVTEPDPAANYPVFNGLDGKIYAKGFKGGRPVLLQWNGTAWRELGNVHVVDGIAMKVNEYAVLANGEAYAIGIPVRGSTAFYKSIVRHWNGSIWRTILDHTPSLDLTDGIAIAADASGNVFASIGFGSPASRSEIWKWDGTAWSNLGAFTYGGTDAIATDIEVAPNGDIYVAGTYNDGTRDRWAIRKWNETTWTDIDNYVYSNNRDTFLIDMDIDATGNLYVHGQGYSGASGYDSIWILRQYNGSSWNTQTYSLSAKSSWPAKMGIAGGEVYALGQAKDAGGVSFWTVLKWNGTSWSLFESWQRVAGLSSSATSLAEDDHGHIWFYGYTLVSGNTSENYIRIYDPDAASFSQGPQWVPDVSLPSSANDAVVDAQGRIFVVGEQDKVWTVRMWDGTNWTVSDQFSLEPGKTSSAQAVALAPNGDIYVAGKAISSTGNYNAVVRKWDGSSWVTFMNDPGPSLNWGVANAIAIHPTTGDIFVGGEVFDTQGYNIWATWRWTSGAGWSPAETWTIRSERCSMVNDLVISPEGDVYAVGEAEDNDWAIQAVVRKFSISNGSWSTFDSYVSNWYSTHSAAAFSPDGKLTVAGGDTIAGSNKLQWSVRQWDGTQWVQLMNYYLQVDEIAIAKDMVFDAQGNLYVAGEAEISKMSGKRWVVRKFNGHSWSTTEVYETAPGYASSANALSLGPDGKTIYTVGAVEASYENLWVVRKQ